MSNPYSFYINDLMVVVYASTKAEAEKKFSKSMKKYKEEIRADAFDECIEMVKSHSDDDKLMNDYYVELLEELKRGGE